MGSEEKERPSGGEEKKNIIQKIIDLKEGVKEFKEDLKDEFYFAEQLKQIEKKYDDYQEKKRLEGISQKIKIGGYVVNDSFKKINQKEEKDEEKDEEKEE